MTRAPNQSAEFVRLLEQRGAQVTSLPLIRIGPPPDEQALQDAVDRADACDWLVFTSAAGVEAFARRRKKTLRPELRIATVGPATKSAVEQLLDARVDVMPAQFSGGALADAIAAQSAPLERVLILAAQDASPILAAKLREAGLVVEQADAYTTLESPPHDLQAHVARTDVITLASPSAVRALVRGLGEQRAAETLRGKLLACIGPVTLLEARGRGLHVEIVPTSATLPALVDAVCRYYTSSQS